MGIKNLYPFLERHGLGDESIPLAEFSGQTFAMDGAQLVCTYKHANAANWLANLDKMMAVLATYSISPILVFDGPPQAAKAEERAKRKDSRKQTRIRYETMRAQVGELRLGQKMSAEMRSELEKYRRNHKIAMPVEDNVVTADCIAHFNQQLVQMAKNAVSVDWQDFVAAVQLCIGRNIRCLRAVGEGEKLCVWLQKTGQADVVVSADGDCLALGCGTLITKILLNDCDGGVNHVAKCYRLDKILAGLELTYDAFLDMCILFGTDFNTNVPNFSTKAYAAIKVHATKEAVLAFLQSQNRVFQMAEVNPPGIRALFTDFSHEDRHVDLTALVMTPNTLDAIFAPSPKRCEDEDTIATAPTAFSCLTAGDILETI